MTDYTKLVEALRCGEYKPECGSSDCPYWSGLGCMDGQLMEDAAAAIEALQKTLKAVQTNSGINFRMWEEAQAEVERLQAELPKRREIVRCKECIHFTQGGWCDREFDWFPVDENDFCSMAEKMEVQDGQ